jgi:uncharacterized membrane protein (UPF0127 family)
VRVRHDADGRSRILASDVEVAESVLSQTRGLMFRSSIPEDYALVFDFDAASTRDVHMLFVWFPIDAIWLVDETVTHVKRLRPWIGVGRADADTLIELPAGAASEVDVGDVVRVED